MFLKKRRKYLKPEIIVEDFLEDVTPFAESVPTAVVPDTEGSDSSEGDSEAKRGFTGFGYNNFKFEDEFDDYE